MIPLTYIICQKRHMMRLFPGERGAGDRNGNVLPGNNRTACAPYCEE